MTGPLIEEKIKAGAEAARLGIGVLDGISRSAASVALFFAVSMMIGIGAMFYLGVRTMSDVHSSIEELGKQMRTGDKEIVAAIQEESKARAESISLSYRAVIQAIQEAETKREATLFKVIEMLNKK